MLRCGVGNRTSCSHDEFTHHLWIDYQCDPILHGRSQFFDCRRMKWRRLIRGEYQHIRIDKPTRTTNVRYCHISPRGGMCNLSAIHRKPSASNLAHNLWKVRVMSVHHRRSPRPDARQQPRFAAVEVQSRRNRPDLPKWQFQKSLFTNPLIPATWATLAIIRVKYAVVNHLLLFKGGDGWR
jgi:hypothetical protein